MNLFRASLCPQFMKAYTHYTKDFKLQGLELILQQFYSSDKTLFEESVSTYGYITSYHYYKVFNKHPLVKDYNNNIRDLITNPYISKHIFEKDLDSKRIVLYQDMVYKISLWDSDIERGNAAYLNFTDKLLAPIEYCGVMEVGNESYTFNVTPYIPDRVSDDQIRDYIDTYTNSSLREPGQESYEGIDGFRACNYVVLENGLRIDDAHNQNFRALNGSVYMIDYEEVDL